MKSPELKNAWIVQSAADPAGRRQLILVRNSASRLAPPVVARRRYQKLRLAVQSGPEVLSGFAPVIRFSFCS